MVEGYGFGGYGGYGGGGFAIGARRGDGVGEGEDSMSIHMRSGLASPSTSVSSSGGSAAGYEAYMPPRAGFGVTREEAY